MIATFGRISRGGPAAGTPVDRFAFPAAADGRGSAHRRFEAAARLDPAAPAAVWRGRAMAYGELNGLANRLARVLRRRGIGPEARVAVAMERGPELAVALLAVLKAGGAYVPVDPAYPDERIRYVVRDSGAALVLTHTAAEARLADAGAPLLSIDLECGLLRGEDPGDLADDPHPQSLAYVIYTSGSTGRPKGVGITHRSLASHGAAVVERYGLHPADRAAQITSIGFDISVEEIFPTWAAGGAVVFRAPEVPSYGAGLLAWLAEEGITVLNLPTAFWHAWTRDLSASGAALPAALRLVVAGGERAQPAVLAEWRRMAPEVRWLNAYGPTEATVTATVHEPAAPAEGEVPIGRAMPNARAHVLSGGMDPLAPGEAGELFLGGEGVARGYLGRPALTAERFLPDPFAPEAGARLYRTGDRARVRPDGELEFLGRTDEQVKVAGFRVEPGEVEAVLAEHPAIGEAAVVAREVEGAGTRLVAYAVPRGAGADTVDATELRRWMRERLPGWLVPAAVVVLEALPLTAHGKVDRRGLPAPETLDVSAADGMDAGTAGEVARAWAEVLGVPRVPADADFWELGGHSLLAMQVLSRLRARLGVELPVRALFDAPTAAALAARIDAARAEPLPAAAAPLRAERRSGPLPLSHAQERLWFLHQLEPESPFYNIPFAVRMRGVLDGAALRDALAAIVRRHEALRTTFHADASGSWQTIHPPPSSFELPLVDLRTLPAEWREGERRRLLAKEAARPFDLRRDPMLRGLLVRLAEDEHVLALTLHHAAGDGWSIGVLFHELAALCSGASDPLPELPVQYADYACWQRERMRGPALEAQVAYWRERLAGAPAALELPADRPRPARQSHRGASRAFELPPRLTTRLRALAREADATLFMVLLAAFDLLLHRLGGRDDVVVGAPVAGRVRPEVEGVIGFFANTLPLRTDLSGDPSFRALVGRVRETTLEAYAHQEVPFGEVVRAVRPERTLSHNPLFQAAFALQNAGMEPVDLPGLSLRLEEVESGTSKFDLFLEMEERDGGLRGRLEYAADLWEPASAERMVARFRRLLEGVAADPDRPLSSAELSGAGERRALLRRGRGASRPFPRASTLHAEFARVAQARPDAVALVWDGGEMTYGELHARSSRLADHLRRAGAGVDEPVALVMERGAELVVSLLGILKAGGAYLPVDPSYPRERLRMMLEDSGARLLVTRERWMDAVEGLPVRAVLIDRDRYAIGREPELSPAVETGGGVGGEAAAYVVYTSGSTGRPKGVVVPHRAVLRLVIHPDYARFGPDDVVLQLAPPSFDASTLELWGPLLNGGRVAIHPPGIPEPAALGAFLARHGVTTAWLTAGLFHQVVDVDPGALAGVRQLLAGGDVLSVPRVRRVLEAHPAVRLVNGYGPTENTTFSCCHHVRTGDTERASIPIGRPIANGTVYVLDARGRPAPVDVPGELFVGGEGVARGYLGRPGLTAERYFPDPFSRALGARLYRTGDRARWRPDGTLEFLGRIDQQVKVRGHRVEPGEIECALSRHPEVAAAAVQPREDGADGRRLVAYVVPARGAERGGLVPRLREWLRGELPEYMLPAALVVMEALPLTPNGKVDRRALPAPPVRGTGTEGTEPRTEAERRLAALWAEVLRVERVFADDSFFDLGGHSLVATRLMSRIRRAFGIDLPLRALFSAPTLAELAREVEAARAAAEGGQRIPPILPLPADTEPPLSFAQERMWFLDRLSGGTGAYNVPVALELDGPLEAEALRGALSDVTARHEALRTRIVERDGEPRAQVAAPAAFPLPVLDVAEEELDARVEEEARRDFDLAAEVPIRAALFRIGPDRHVLVLTMHHVATDGWSLGIVMRDLAAAYGARVDAGTRAAPPALRYADYAAWQRGWLRGEALERQVGFWRRQLEGAPTVLALPTDHPRPSRQSFRGAVHPFSLPPEVARGIHALAAEEQATPFMTGLAAFAALLGRYAGVRDVVVGAPVAGRHREESEPIVGLFVNTLALRADLSGDPSFRALVRRLRESTLEAYAHQDLPFERLVDALEVERALDRTPVFQVMFAAEEARSRALPVFPGLAARERLAPHRTAKFDLTLTLEAGGGGFDAVLEYATDLFDPATARRIGDHFVRLLSGALSYPDRPLSTIEAATEAERAEHAAWNAAAARPEHLRLPPVHEQAAARAARTPDAVAVAWEGGSLTFAELHARANRLANHLVAQGVRPESRVALCMERSPEMVVGLLAAVKAGAAYLPVDPEYPAERIAWLLRDSRAPVVLTLARLAPSLPATDARVIAVDAEWERIQRASAEAPAVQVHPENVAYVIYTSGSTGRPKGVEVSHGALANHMAWMERAYPLGPDGAVLQKTPFGFDASVWEFWAPLLEGGRLVLAAPGGHRDPAYLLEVVRRERITTLQFVPSLLAVLADEPGLEACASLRRIFSGGEPLATELVRRVRSRLDVRVVNLYGPTETAIDDASHECVPDHPLPGAPIGTPVDNALLYVTGGALRPVPRGAVGELCVGGAGVARGYLGRPALTAERFVPDPFATQPGARMYRTGDRVRMATDGTLHYLGRADLQVKVRGHRVELGEVEAALLRDPAVREAAVTVRGDAVAAYVVPAAGRRVDGAALRASLRGELPEFMVPGAILVLDALPRTPNGKVDREALPEARPLVAEGHVPPATETERALADVWAVLLPRDGAGREDGFFDLGGHSLLAMQLLARVRGRFGVDLPIRAVFESPRLREMAARIDAARAPSAVKEPDPGIVPIDRDGPLALSFAQERMWFLDRLLPGSPVYSMPFRLLLRGGVEVEALRRALEDLSHRHEALRTVFASCDGRPVQQVARSARFHLPVTDLSLLPGEVAEGEAERISDEEARRPFDLAAGPLFRARLVRIAAERWTLLLNLHHAVADGWSLDLLFRELSLAYGARVEGVEPALPLLPVQYPDYAAWQRRRLSGARLEEETGWWRERLAGAPVLELPADHPRPAAPTFGGAWVTFGIAPKTSDAVEALARAEAATRFHVLLGAFAILLSRWSGEKDVVVGSPVAGRGRPEVEGMVGLFVNTLALRTDLSGDPDFREVVRRVRVATVDAFAHQEVPFERLVDELRIERTLSRHPLFQVSFSVLPPASPDPQLRGARTTIEPVVTGTAKFDLTLQLLPCGDGLEGGIEYATDLFSPGTARRLAEGFTALTDALAADPDRRLSRLPALLSDEDRRLVLNEWSGTDRPVSTDPIHTRIAAVAAAMPGAAALSIGGRTVTYGSMEARANRLANRLVARGVRPESVVGIVAERAPETVIALLAVLKAGGAYLPLDPAYPAERLRSMLADSRARLLVSAGAVPPSLRGFAGEVVRMEEPDTSGPSAPPPEPLPGTHPDSLAYVIYTSGSTGRPKGVAVPHRGIANLAAWQRDRLGVRLGDRMLQFASFSFDAAVGELFAALTVGATLVFAPREALVPGPALRETLRRERIAYTYLPPSALCVMEPDELPELRVVLAAGEALPIVATARWAGKVELHNAYGPTETTVAAASARVHADGRLPPIGRPLDNARGYVLDAAGEPVPPGVPGELHVGGIGVARGYLHRPALTAERFVPDPFGAPGSRLYRTGDRVRWREDGNLEFLGRVDAQVKVRGYRIEPGEIAARLAEVDGVHEALVLVRPDARGEPRLVAYVAAPERAPSPAELREHLRAVLPEYMVPHAYVVMDAFPRTPSGKTDPAVLPPPADVAAVAGQAPRGELEVAIAEVWREVLDLAAVGVHDSFFEIGGHSLLMARLQERLRTALGREVSMVELFQYPTVASLAAHLEASSQAEIGRDVDAGREKPAGRGRGAARRDLLRKARR